MQIVKKVGIALLICALIVVIFYVTYSAVGAFGRNDVTLCDNDYISRDGTTALYVRGSTAIYMAPEQSTTYQIELVDGNLATLTAKDGTSVYALYTDNGNTIYLPSVRTYLYLYEVTDDQA